MKIGMSDIEDEFILVPGDNYVSASSFLSMKDYDGEALLSGQAERWSKWGEIEIRKGNPTITFDNPDAYGRIHFTGIMKLKRQTAEKMLLSSGRHIGESLQEIASQTSFEVLKAEYWHNIVYPWDLISGNRMALRDNLLFRSAKIEKNVVIKGEVSIGKGTVIRSGSYILGPVSIGEGCDIGPNSVIGSAVSIGNNVIVGPFSEIVDSVVMSNCDLGSYTSLKGSVLGSGVSFGSHSIAIPSTRNIMYFDKEFSVSDRGAMIGDDCIIGSRATLQGGSILLSGATIGEGEFYNADFQGDNI
jgi:glucose-1-phosphate thymidylyltransferase